MKLVQRFALFALVLGFAYSSSLFAQTAFNQTTTHNYTAPATPAKESGYIGVQLSVRSSDFALVVDRVVRGTKAEFSGLQSGDVITKIEGAAVHSNCDMYHAMSGKGPGDDILVTVNRNGEEQQVHVTLSSSQEVTTASQQPSTMPQTNSIYVSACERLEKEFYNNPLLGVYVNSTGSATLTGTIPNTGAVRAELVAGDIIEQIDGTNIPSFVELKSTISTHRPGDRVIVSFRRDGVVRNVEAVLNSYAEVNPEAVQRLVDECSKKNGGFIAGERINKVELTPANLNLAPNPSTGLVNLSLTGLDAQELTIRVTDLIGNKFVDRRIENSSSSYSTSLDLSDAPKGVYLVTIQQGNKTIKEKLIVE